MKKLILAAAVMSVFAGSLAHAEDVIPEHTFTGNVTLATDYRFRGLSQTFKEPTIQGGFDYAHSSGFYVGNWNSNVDTSAINNGNIEMDLYGGYKFAIAPDLTGDVGVLHYYYPGAETAAGKSINTTEVYVGATYKWFSAKYSHAVSDFFGVDNSKGSGYLDLGAAFEVAEKTTLSFHVGRQKVRHNSASDYTDYKVGIARDFGFATISLAAIGTNAKDDLPLTKGTKTKKTGDTTAVLSISKAF
ncbi:conserved hypothetical protein; putative exported protein [Herminiimonas arsenicoxydans]|uniref:Uncharacterized protein n=1 Tax=Herminiimonas arsenicoxydans TaxID=204773 RepID=A4G1J0_HERAR|nr:conserved hypothetical protein; putative exported protein [Herminiimonas arsenicoxydans]